MIVNRTSRKKVFTYYYSRPGDNYTLNTFILPVLMFVLERAVSNGREAEFIMLLDRG